MTTHKTNPGAFWSEDRTGRNDRLVKRFTTAGRLHVHLRLGARGTDYSRPVVAEVTDVSITGLLLGISGGLRVRPGAMVTLGDEPSLATCRVIHTNTPLGARMQRLGVEIITQSPEFREELRLTVGALRKDLGQVLEAWEHGD